MHSATHYPHQSSYVELTETAVILYASCDTYPSSCTEQQLSVSPPHSSSILLGFSEQLASQESDNRNKDGSGQKV